MERRQRGISQKGGRSGSKSKAHRWQVHLHRFSIYVLFFFIKEVIQFAEPVFFGTSFFGKSFFIGTSLVAQKKRVLLLK